jgi:citrate lyase subunit beta/citryl-CoA lyase
MVEKATTLDADVAFLDLEDAVAPSEKAAARAHVIRAFRDLDWRNNLRAYRVNGLQTPHFYRDLIEVVEAVDVVDLIIVPKVDRPEDVYVVATLLNQLELVTGRQERIGIEVQIESAEGLLNVSAIAAASPRVEALIFGPGDFAASMRMPHDAIGVRDEWDRDYGSDRWHFAMMAIAVAGRAAGIRVIDGPYAQYSDPSGLRKSCRRARALGFDGKWCIHPDQIQVINEVFTPSEQELAWARTVIAAYDQAAAGKQGAVSVGGSMVDAASIAIARRTLDAVRHLGQRRSPSGE